MIEFKEELLTKDVWVHCRTKEQAIKFCTWMDAKGLDWRKEENIFTLWEGAGSLYSAYCNVMGTDWDDKEVITYEEALRDTPIQKELLIYNVHVGKYDLYEVLSFVQELLLNGYTIELATTPTTYKLKGFK
jgi:hypothetical protein